MSFPLPNALMQDRRNDAQSCARRCLKSLRPQVLHLQRLQAPSLPKSLRLPSPKSLRLQSRLKKPAGADVAAAAAAAAPAAAIGGKPPPTFVPLHWGGGRLYWSGAKSAWRVYTRTCDKVESTVRVDRSDGTAVAKKWKKCLRLIREDPRPAAR